MSGSVLDTNVITKVLDKDPAALRMVERIETLYTSVIVVGELYFAALKSGRVEANLKLFREALSHMEIIPSNETVNMAYAKIKLELKKKGTPIPENDIWIAACAFVKKLSVATFDGHFSQISEIELVEIDQ
jgi:tRNA(fMet)-specific endonuclease VapC